MSDNNQCKCGKFLFDEMYDGLRASLMDKTYSFLGYEITCEKCGHSYTVDVDVDFSLTDNEEMINQ